jgi:hypothetical protein
MVESVYAANETQRRIFSLNIKIFHQQSHMTVLSMENVSWMIFEDGRVGHKCMDTAVARPTAKRRARSPLYLKYGLGKAVYLSLAD